MICPYCKEDKPRAKFIRRIGTRNVLQPKCKECRNWTKGAYGPEVSDGSDRTSNGDWYDGRVYSFGKKSVE